MSWSTVLRGLGVLSLGWSLGGCPRGSATQEPLEACKELGQKCEFAPGKLGACSYKTNCEGPGCLYCQSQH